MKDCNELLGEHVIYLHDILRREIDNGTSSESYFSEVNVEHLNDALSQLQTLDLSFDLEFHERNIHNRVCKFQERLFVDAFGFSFDGYHQDLEKLKTWCFFGRDYKLLFDPVIDHAVAYVKGINGEVRKFDVKEIHSSSETELRRYFLNLICLKSLRNHSRGLSAYIDGVPQAMETFERVLSDLKSEFQILNEGFLEIEQRIDFGDEEMMENLSDQIRNIEMISDLLRGTNIEDDLLPSIELLQKLFESKVTGRFDSFCTKLKDTGYANDLLWFEGLTKLRESVSRFSAFEGNGWNGIASSYLSVVYGLKAYLKTKTDLLNEQSQDAFKHGLVEGTRDGEFVEKFAKYQWFDDFLPSEERFVRNSLTKIMSDYMKIFSDSAETFERILFWLSSATNLQENSVDATKKLKASASMISMFRAFGFQVVDVVLIDRTDRLFDQLESYIIDRKGKWEESLEEWTDIVGDTNSDCEKVTLTTELLNLSLCEIVEILEINCKEETQEVVRSVRETIITKMVEFKQNVEESLCSNIDYEKIATFLNHVEALGTFEHTAEHLPELGPLIESTLRRVTKDAENIEEKAISTINFTEIDSLIVQFEKAEILDGFLNNEPSKRLRLLKRLRVDREDGTDKLVDDMIEQNDFVGLGALLEPLTKSTDNYEKMKLTAFTRKIKQFLRTTDEKLRKNFDGPLTEEKCKRIAELLTILEQSKESVGKYLPTKTRTRKHSAIEPDWKTKVNQKLTAILARMGKSIAQPDFVESAKYEEKLNICSRHLAPFLKKAPQSKIQQILKKYDNLKSSIPSKIKHFIDTSFGEWKELVKILSALELTTKIKDPKHTDLSQLYTENTYILHEHVKELIDKIEESAKETHCYDDSIEILKSLKRALENGLRSHLPTTIEADCNSMLEKYGDIRKQDFNIGIEILTAESEFEKLGERMDKLDPANPWWKKIPFLNLSGSKTYGNLKRKMVDMMSNLHTQGNKALKNRDFITLNETLHLLGLMNSTIARHVPPVSMKLEVLKRRTVEAFKVLCKESQDALQSDNYRDFEPLFPDYRGFVINITTLMEDRKALTSFNLVNQLVYERMSKEVSIVEEKLNGFDFETMKLKVDEVRTFGGFIADRFSLFHEQLKAASHAKSDRWLGLLQSMISKFFQNGRDLRRLKYFAILNIYPSSTKNEINQACEVQTTRFSSSNQSDKLVLLKEAMRAFENDGEFAGHPLSRPFDDHLHLLGNNLREMTREALREENYDLIHRLLFNLQGIEIIEHLVRPKLDTEKICEDVYCLVKDHIKKVRIEVDSNWSQRKYQDLNHNIKDLKVMEEKFKSYSHIFATSWNTGLVESVEKEIDKLGKDAMLLLETRKSANQSRDEFRRCFMRMGAVFVELPQFKDFTEKVMSDVLESCLNSEWGYGFVFDLGLSLQKGEDTNNEDEVRIAQHLVTEFSHFKEVLTMVWNEETITKPAEDTVEAIRGDQLDAKTLDASPLDIDSDELLDRFFDFESEYKSLLGKYLTPDADLNDLVQKIINITDKMKPISCDDGFGDETKLALPKIISGVFALFTILKSGDSYNRFDNAADADSMKSKLLMKPHNIQILSLLCMFGCGTSNSRSLHSQLMQIRTGEGKSMILGAAATIFGLLGFEVRCVCYSEYLSNRDFELFRDVFGYFGLLESINYSIITTLSEETTASKGNIREMTLSLIRVDQSTNQGMDFSCIDKASETSGTKTNKTRPPPITNSSVSSKRARRSNSEEIMLVDEVDVFFGSEFYGRKFRLLFFVRAISLSSMWK